jgi:hypothetical protein
MESKLELSSMSGERQIVIPRSSHLFTDKAHFEGWKAFNKRGSVEWADDMQEYCAKSWDEQ